MPIMKRPSNKSSKTVKKYQEGGRVTRTEDKYPVRGRTREDDEDLARRLRERALAERQRIGRPPPGVETNSSKADQMNGQRGIGDTEEEFTARRQLDRKPATRSRQREAAGIKSTDTADLKPYTEGDGGIIGQKGAIAQARRELREREAAMRAAERARRGTAVYKKGGTVKAKRKK
jgi:hypothetical protein